MVGPRRQWPRRLLRRNSIAGGAADAKPALLLRCPASTARRQRGGRHGRSREVQREQQLGLGVAAAILIWRSAIFGFQLFGGGEQRQPPAPTSAFYTDDNGKTFFKDNIDKVVPFDHNGKQAYRADVFQVPRRQAVRRPDLPPHRHRPKGDGGVHPRSPRTPTALLVGRSRCRHGGQAMPRRRTTDLAVRATTITCRATPSAVKCPTAQRAQLVHSPSAIHAPQPRAGRCGRPVAGD